MELECEKSHFSANATEAQIQSAFADDAGRGDFIILSKADGLIQAGGVKDGPYSLEYQTDNPDAHFQCTRDVTKAEVEAAFLKYLKGDATWQTDFEWKAEEERKPWWKFW